ncbi:MAG: PQQ-binding-like beta-propeller repeat protein [Verrucomicrobia bacterium]|nr:PQQ-binding-like beta-propeller repeat protein [Verrucomicrobiota bacterium]MCH8526088.1 PQQ-like beta-propeller repeat protein [Kiritimatiellia bacterium]
MKTPRKSFRNQRARQTVSVLAAFAFSTLLHASDWGYRTAHNYVVPQDENVELTPHGHLVRPLWSYEIHTGMNSSSSGPTLHILQQGFEPTYGETAAAVVVEGIYILSWSEATGDVSARQESLTDRYHGGDESYAALKDTYYRIDANWNTLALNADTGEKLWQVSQPSASINFQSSKRSHNGIDPVADNGLYVTLTVTGRVFAYEIATGELRWQTTIPEWHERAEAFKAEALEKRNLPIVDDGPFGTLRPGAAMVGDSVIIPDLRGGLIALNSSDGSELWRIEQSVMNRQGNPRRWAHGGKTYLITHENSGDRAVFLIDPDDGSVLWRHETGHNPGKLILGDDFVMLNPEREDPGLLAAYRISLEGLERLWRFPDEREGRAYKNHVHLGGSRGPERKGLIENGRLYIALGHPGKRPETRKLGVFDIVTGEELYRSDYNITNSVAAPTSYNDKIYWQITNTSAENAGLYIYQKHEDGSLERTGEARYRPLGSMLTTDYSYPTDRPFTAGRTFLRGRTNIVALDLTVPPPGSADLQLKNAWAGFHRPVEGVLIGNESREITSGRIEVPPRDELGVVGTTARRTDVWSHIEFEEGLKLGGAWETGAEVHMSVFSWPARIVMEEAEGREWRGKWTRSFPGWEETLTREGSFHESSEGGYPRRGWPTGWLEHQPVTFFSELEEGQERVFLQIFGSLPREGGDFQNMTLCLDHDGEKVVSAVAGGFRYNQSYHEVDASGLTVTAGGITGTARIILNGDPWMRDPDWKNGGSLMGLLTVDARFGEANGDGIYPVSGDWTLEWGIAGEQTGKIRASLSPQVE